MNTKPQLTTPQRYEIIELVHQGKTYEEVAETVGCGKSTVSYNVRKMEIEKNLRNRRKSGRPKKIDQRTERSIVHMALQDPLISSRKMAQFINIERTPKKRISDRSIRAVLQKKGLKSLVRPSKIVISEKNMEERLGFAKILQKMKIDFWERIVFSDECLFESFVGRPRVRARNSNTALRNFPLQRERQGVRVLAWGAISSFGQKVLVFLDENVTAESYLNTLETHLLPNFEVLQHGDAIFQHDNAPAHRAHTVVEFLENSQVETLPWPAQSPDLNIIENIWGFMKAKLRAHYSNEAELRAHVLEVWESIEDSMFENLYLSMPSRLQEVIRNKGGPTSY
jgi:transposase